jgi:enoyl reductase-like protein
MAIRKGGGEIMAVETPTWRLILFIIVVYFIEGLIYGSSMWEMVQPTVDAGFWGQLTGGVEFIGSLLTFNIPELPKMLRWLLTAPILSGLALSIANLIRG